MASRARTTAAAALSAAAFVIAGAGPASALRIQVQASGVLDAVYDPTALLTPFGVDVGDTFSGLLEYDVPIADSDASASSGAYTDVDTVLALSHDESNAGVALQGPTISVFDGASDGLDVSGPPDTINLFPVVDVVIFSLADSSGTVFGSDALPTTLALGDFTSSFIEVSGPDFVVEGHLTALSVTALPEPGSILIVVSALGGLVRLLRSEGT